MSIKTDLTDLAERVGWTFAETFLAVYVITDVSTIRMAAVAGLAAAIVPVKEFVKRKRAERA